MFFFFLPQNAASFLSRADIRRARQESFPQFWFDTYCKLFCLWYNSFNPRSIYPPNINKRRKVIAQKKFGKAEECGKQRESFAL
jgi:hypothetical protein